MICEIRSTVICKSRLLVICKTRRKDARDTTEYSQQAAGMHPTGMHSCYRPQQSWGKVIFSVACVKNSVHGEGVCPISCWDTPPPQTRGEHPPGADTPLGPEADTPPGADLPPEQTPYRNRHPPGAHTSPPQCMLGDTGNKQAVCILLECNLVLVYFCTN